MPSVCGVCGAITKATSASGSSSGEVLDGVHPDRLGTRPPGDPGHRGDLEAGQPALDGRADAAVADDQHPLIGQCDAELEAPDARRLVAGEVSRCRPLASASATASSAVLASCTPAALHRITPSGTSGRKFSTPAVRVWMTFRLLHLRDAVEHLLALHVGQHVELDLGDRIRPAGHRRRGRSRCRCRRGFHPSRLLGLVAVGVRQPSESSLFSTEFSVSPSERVRGGGPDNPAAAIAALTSAIRSVPKWKTVAASTASAPGGDRGREVLEPARPAGGDQRHVDHRAHGADHLQVEARRWCRRRPSS